MQELFIIRHGFAGQSLEDRAMDEERPLKKKGKEQIKGVAKGLKELNLCFDVVITSPLLRAKETAEIINSYCGDSKKVIENDLLRPGGSFSNLIKFLNKHKKYKKVAIVGHEPFLSSFASYCLTKNKNSVIELKKGGVLMLEVEDTLKPGQCKLTMLIEPEHLG